MGHLEIVIADTPTADDCRDILNPLVEYNTSNGPPHRYAQLAILLRDPDSGQTVGGLWGKASYDWVNVEFLAVPAQFRGKQFGTALLRKAEDFARTQNCVGLWLDTFAFQARGFYEKNGFEVFGVLDEHPRGSQRFFMRKRLT